MKKVVSLLMSLIMLFSVCVVPAMAKGENDPKLRELIDVSDARKVLLDWSFNSETTSYQNWLEETCAKIGPDVDMDALKDDLLYVGSYLFDTLFASLDKAQMVVMLRSQMLFDDLAKLLDAFQTQESEPVFQILLEIYPDFAEGVRKIVANSLEDQGMTDPELTETVDAWLKDFYAQAKANVWKNVFTFGNSEVSVYSMDTFKSYFSCGASDEEMDELILAWLADESCDTFGGWSAKITGVIDDVYSAEGPLEGDLLASATDVGNEFSYIMPLLFNELMKCGNMEIMKCMLRSQILYDDWAKALEAPEEALPMTALEIFPDFLEGIKKCMDDSDAPSDDPSECPYANTAYTALREALAAEYEKTDFIATVKTLLNTLKKAVAMLPAGKIIAVLTIGKLLKITLLKIASIKIL